MSLTRRVPAFGAPMALGAGAASSADLPARVAPVPSAAPLPVFTWPGAQVGLNADAVTVRAESLRPALDHSSFTAARVTTPTADAIRSRTEGDVAPVGPTHKV